jgi:3-oxoacyl-[acyl-carrier protein] reductase
VKAQDGKVVRKMSLSDFNKVIAVDLTAVFQCGRDAAVQMIESGNGAVIINTSSISRAGRL